ncbi:MAG: hypothetical protein HY273_15810 [Gammaproteobacteria bacterium]|nr:hypothetical protein [Gammaproteobacteria bacterium]
MKVTINKTSVSSGETLEVHAIAEVPDVPAHVQVNVVDCGTRNPGFVLANGPRSKPDQQGRIIVELHTESLSPGIYEIASIVFRFEAVDDPRQSKAVSYRCGKDFPRIFFEVIEQIRQERNHADLAREVATREADIESSFLSEIDVRSTPEPSKYFSVLCFVSGVSITTRMRFDRWEVMPFRSLDERNLVEVVNEFIEAHCAIKVHFEYATELRDHSHAARPVSVVHFPTIRANNAQHAKDYCYGKALMLTEILSYCRGAAGYVFNIVVFDRDTGQAELFTNSRSYGGNLLGGRVSGEDPERIVSLIEKLEVNQKLRYFIALHKEALGEIDINYQYLRYWLVLELIAESKNYNPADGMLDENLKPVLDKNGGRRKLKDASNSVYKLLLDAGFQPAHCGVSIANTYSLLHYVDAWAAWRNAAGHYGRFEINDPGQAKNFRGYDVCAKSYADQGNKVNGFVLEELKRAVKYAIDTEIS